MIVEPFLRKYVRLPWEVHDGRERYQDVEVAARTAFECGAGEDFKTLPEAEEFFNVLSAMAVPMTLALIHGRGGALKKRNKWLDLPAEEKAHILAGLNISPKSQFISLILSSDAGERFRLASYIAAAYAFTTYTKPYVIHFEKLAQVIFSSLYGDVLEMQELKNSGLLVIIGTGGQVSGADKIYGFLSSILERRIHQGRVTVILDGPEGDVLDDMIRKKGITREAVAAMYKDIFPAKFRMGQFLYGPQVHIYPVDAMELLKNERRQTIIV